MLKRAVACAVLSCIATGAQAADPTWKFTYTGFEVFNGGWWGLGEGTFDPNLTYSIEFAGTDQDKDGLIEYAELSKLMVNNTWSGLGCGTTDDDCQASFAFGTGNALSFTYDSERGPEFEPFFSEYWIHLGTEIGSRFTSTGVIQYDNRYRWTPETRLDVLTPVPEPGAWAMMGAGLAVLAGVGARRRKAPVAKI